MAILLIGSTGNGKSCLGNFLINPADDHIWQQPTFATATTNMPETDDVQEALSSIKLPDCDAGDFSFRVIDTPGLNDKDVKVDLRHMIGLIEALQKVELIHACILVVKFESKIDAQYVSTVQYYSKLLPSLFEKNVIVVMTAYSTDDRSVKIRERKCINTDEVKKNTLKVIFENGCLAYEPMLFLVDSLPYDKEERQLNLKERVTILQYINSLMPVELDSSKIAKTHYIQQNDQETIKKYEGEITGYNERLKQTQEQHATKLQAIEETEKEITDLRYKLQNLKEEKDELNSNDPAVVKTWSFSEPWKFLRRVELEFKMCVPYRDVSISRWDNGKCTWEQWKETQDEDGATLVSGKVVGSFMRGVYVSVTITTAKKYKYASRIVDLMNRIDLGEKEEQNIKKKLQDIVSGAQECDEEVKLLRTYIEEKRQLIEKLNSEWMTLEEARRKLAEYERRKLAEYEQQA